MIATIVIAIATAVASITGAVAVAIVVGPFPALTDAGRRLLAVSLSASAVVLLAVLLLGGCTPAQRSSVAPALSEVASRVDLARVLECAGRPDRWRCLGAAAASAAIDAAADRAERLAREAQAALAGTGAADTDEDEIAAELDAALADLGRAIAAGQGGAS